MLRKLDLIGVQSDWGLAAGASIASRHPVWRACGGSGAAGPPRTGQGDILAPRTGPAGKKLLHYEQVSEVNRRVYLSVTETLEEGRFPVILAATTGIAAGSIAAVSKRHSGNIGHPDRCPRRLEQRGEHMHRQYARDALFRCLWLRT